MLKMIDVPLSDNLIKAIDARAGMIFVGDVDQLTSVGPVTILSDLIVLGTVPVTRLTALFRKGGAACIIRVAHQIDGDKTPYFLTKTDHDDCYFLTADDPEALAEEITTLVRGRLTKAYDVTPVHYI